MEQQAFQLPSSVYYVAGAIILTNIGTIVSLFYAAIKTSWWLSKLDSRVTIAKATADRAHKRIDSLEEA
jgi:hypothetical protein